MKSNEAFLHTNAPSYAKRLSGLFSRMVAFFVMAALALFFAGFSVSDAHAVTTEIYDEPDAAQQQVEESAREYDEAVGRVDELTRQAEENERRIQELESNLPQQRANAGEALAELYKMQRGELSIVELVFSSKDVFDLINRAEFVNRLYEQHKGGVDELVSALSDLDATRSELQRSLAEAESERERASEALASAQEARERAQAEAQAKAEEEARLAEEAAHEAASSDGGSGEGSSSAGSSDSSGSSSAGDGSDDAAGGDVNPPNDDGADWSSDKASFVAAWAGRIDAYLAGSPLAGQGETFAVAAWDYGVDPRFSPAISAVESTKGAYCAYPHNAWGWGSVSWGSWEEAIDAHVRGLARGYGYTLTEEGAKKYCPPNWEHWYNRVGEEMNRI